jgi:hypothetical protein
MPTSHRLELRASATLESLTVPELPRRRLVSVSLPYVVGFHHPAREQLVLRQRLAIYLRTGPLSLSVTVFGFATPLLRLVSSRAHPTSFHSSTEYCAAGFVAPSPDSTSCADNAVVQHELNLQPLKVLPTNTAAPDCYPSANISKLHTVLGTRPGAVHRLPTPQHGKRRYHVVARSCDRRGDEGGRGSLRGQPKAWRAERGQPSCARAKPWLSCFAHTQHAGRRFARPAQKLESGNHWHSVRHAFVAPPSEPRVGVQIRDAALNRRTCYA